MNRIKISIIIPVYNTEEYLKRCLNSVINQSIKDIEIIIINDGSVDNCLSIINEYKNKDQRIILINQSNQGLSAARNAGLEIASGEYISFVDSDDSIELNMIEELLKETNNSKIDIVVSQNKNIINNKIVSYTVLPRKLSNNHFINILNTKMSPSVCTKIFKKELFIKNDILFPLNFNYEENITCIKLFYYAKNVIYLNNPYSNYHIRESSITNSLSIKNMNDIFKVAIDMELFLKEKKILKLYKKEIFFRTIKLLNSFVLPNLLEKNKNELIKNLIVKINNSYIFTKENFEQLKQNSKEQYLSFLTLVWQINEIFENRFNFLIDLFDQNILNKITSSMINKKFQLEYSLLNYLIKSQICEIIIYGKGQIFENLLPLFIKNNIKVVAILDKNSASMNSCDFNIISKSEIKEYPYPIVITSLVFSSDIRDELKEFTLKKKLNNSIIDIYSCLGIK